MQTSTAVSFLLEIARTVFEMLYWKVVIIPKRKQITDV